jgi:arsenate reductase
MINVLFLCTANSARSILAEAILNARGGARFRGFSAGSKPRGEPNPLALALLAAKGHDISALRSKGWEEFAQPGAPKIHLVITVCDNAKGESCPIYPGHPMQAHWGIPDPAGEQDDGEPAAFETAWRRLSQRIDALVALDKAALDPAEWRRAVSAIGQKAEGSTGNG